MSVLRDGPAGSLSLDFDPSRNPVQPSSSAGPAAPGLSVWDYLAERRAGLPSTDPQHRVVRRRAEILAVEIGQVDGADRPDVGLRHPVEHRPERGPAAAWRSQSDAVARLKALGALHRGIAINHMDRLRRRLVQDGADLGGEGGERRIVDAAAGIDGDD